MRRLAAVGLVMLLAEVALGQTGTLATPPTLYINEFMASNQSGITDPAETDEYPDWIEIHNPNGVAVDMAGLYLTDDLATPTKWQFVSGVSIPAYGYLLVYADDDGTQGSLHANFKLSASGEAIGLIHSDGTTVIDSITFGEQTADVSYGRFPDGGSWRTMAAPSPGESNNNPPPIISGTTQSPTTVMAAVPVWVTATVTDDGTVVSVSLTYDAGDGAVVLDMYDDGAHNDGAAADSVFGAQIPGVAGSKTVNYYIAASDDYGTQTTDPASSAITNYSYDVGSAPLDLDHDGDVDAADVDILETCVTGAEVSYDPLPSGCTLTPNDRGYLAVDLDRDGDVDQSDFGAFQLCISGEGTLADATCGAVTDPAINTTITLNGTSIGVDGQGVSVSGTTATIASAGTYTIVGTLNDGQIVVNTEDEGTVQLVLNGASINSTTNAPLFVQNAAATSIVLADQTTNVLSDATTYVYADSTTDEPNAALFSKDPLTIGGTGALTVTGHYADGISCKDGLTITGGTVTVNAVDDGIRGKDYLVVKGATITVTAGGDGFKSDNDENSAKGYVSIEDGSISITSGGDAITAETNVVIANGDFILASGGGSAATLAEDASAKGVKGGTSVTISGGTYTINSADDAIHSNGTVTINGGTIGINSGDEGILGQNAVIVNSGSITVTSAKGDGIKGENETDTTQGSVIVNGGTLNVTCVGDAISAQTTAAILGGGLTLKSGGGSTATLADTASAKGIKGSASVLIKGGTFVINSADDGIHSNGSVSIEGSTTNVGVTSGRDGIAGDTTVTISAGTVSTNTGGGSTVTAADTISAKGIKAGTILTLSGGTFTVNSADDGLHSNGSISIPSGSPSVTITSAKDGIAAETTVNIGSGTFTVTTAKGSNYAVASTLSAKGIKAATSVVIGGGNFTLNVAEDGIHSDSNVTINGGTIGISASDDAIHAETALTISGGTTSITKCYEGLESATITINSGTVSIVASDDGINASKGNGGEQNDGSYLYIKGGTISVTAGHDGIDSNGNISMSGGTVVVQGPASQPEVAIDYNGTFLISGGILVASGPNAGGMIQVPSTSSSQYTVKATGTLAANALFHIQNASGTDIVTFKPVKATYYVLFSSSSLTTGVTYSLYTGGTVTGGTNVNGYYTGGTYSGGTLKKTFTMTSKVTTVQF